MRIVFIHGRSQGGKDPVALRKEWEDSFDEGLANCGLQRPAGLEIRLPFYGDLVDDLVAQLEAPLVADVVERGADADDDEAEFRGEFLAELAEGNRIAADEIAQNYEGDVTERGPLNWRWVRAIMKTLDKSKKLGSLAIDSFTRDVYVYLTKEVVRRRILDLVERDLGGSPCVVVGHSLGSVVGYDLLRRSNHQVARYVTLGSPLAVRAVKRRLQAPLVMPAKTTSWYNALDRQDPVSLYPLDAENFGLQPPIVNYSGVDNPTDNQHGIVGYLPDRWVAAAIHGGLGV
ncbi:MAG: alpha/beta hydrolase [Acidobacteria bacterium]|nr:MAG: alpha/beta hydrolase [Acidobacteriota bacterium]REK06136.1 MAG: alpha/beta hydrolase [Acidobacteriota bacterium]